MPSVRKNIVLNGLNTITGILFPVVTFPYIARVLLPEGVGAVNFLYGIITYIMLLTNLGIPLYAIREVARYQKNKAKRDQTTVEIFCLNISLAAIGYVIVFVLGLYVPRIHANLTLFYILSISIIFNALGINWFYQATENFKFITIRAVIFRVLSAVCLFLFVRTSADLNTYGFILVASTVGNNFINFIHARKIISLKNLNISIKGILSHLKPAIHIFILNLIISLYVQLNTIMLGFLSTDVEVGYFAGGTKIPHVAITLIGSISSVLLPRSAHLLENGEVEQFKVLINKSLQLILCLSYPIVCGLIALATPLIMLFCGGDFQPSIDILIINAPIVFLISVTTLTGLQILYPLGKVNLVILCTSIGAVLNLLLNLILIPNYGGLGATYATTTTEIVVFMLQLYFGRSFFPFKFKDLFPKDIIIGALILFLTIIGVTRFISDNSLKIIIGFLMGTSAYFGVLKISNNLIVKEILAPNLRKLIHRR